MVSAKAEGSIGKLSTAMELMGRISPKGRNIRMIVFGNLPGNPGRGLGRNLRSGISVAEKSIVAESLSKCAHSSAAMREKHRAAISPDDADALRTWAGKWPADVGDETTAMHAASPSADEVGPPAQ